MKIKEYKILVKVYKVIYTVVVQAEQHGRALKVQKVKMNIIFLSLLMLNDKKFTSGEITGIPTNVTTEALKSSIKDVKVSEIKSLRTKRNGEICDSLSLMIKCDEEKLPDDVSIRYMSYKVKLYIPPPLCCNTVSVRYFAIQQNMTMKIVTRITHGVVIAEVNTVQLTRAVSSENELKKCRKPFFRN